MIKRIAVLSTLALVGASLVSTTASAAEKVGASFFITHYRGLPGMPEHAVTFDATKFDQIAYLKNVCDEDLRAQRPGGFKEVVYDVGMSVLGNAGGLALGIAGAGLGSAGDYAKYGAGVGGVTGFTNSITGRGRANRYDIGQCMALQLQWAQKFDGQLLGVGIIMNAHSVNGKGISRPALTAANDANPAVSPSADLANDDTAATAR